MLNSAKPLIAILGDGGDQSSTRDPHANAWSSTYPVVKPQKGPVRTGYCPAQATVLLKMGFGVSMLVCGKVNLFFLACNPTLFCNSHNSHMHLRYHLDKAATNTKIKTHLKFLSV